MAENDRPALPFEWRVTIAIAVLTIVPAASSVWCIWNLSIYWVWRVAAAVAVLATLIASASALHNSATQPLRGLMNVIEGYRSGDFTIRSNRQRDGGTLGDLAYEINSLGKSLREQRLRAMEATALLDKLIGAIDIAVLAFDGERRLRVHNPASERLLGMSIDTAAILSADDLGLQYFLQGPTGTRIVTALRGRSGRWQITHGTFRETGIAQHLLIIADVQQALRAEEHLAWQRLIRVIGHEVNNSLTPIRSLAETLETMLSAALPAGREREEILEALNVIAERTHALGRFLAQYSRLARLPQPCKRWLQLATIMRRIIALKSSESVRIDIPDDLEVLVDPDQLEQALINLTRNALEAQGPADGEVIVAARDHEGTLTITVTDQGSGIVNMDNVFVPFFTTKPNGSGVGLVLSRQIAEAHGGSLSLKNRTDARGAIAAIELPGAARNASSKQF